MNFYWDSKADELKTNTLQKLAKPILYGNLQL